MMKTSNPMPSSNNWLLPYRGNWNLPWVIQRYLRTSVSGLTVNKLVDATLAMIEMRLGKTRIKSKPCILRIEPTNLCNLRCPRCSCGIATDPRKKGYIAIDDYKLVLEQNRRNATIVRLDGNGEPTLHPEIFELIRIAKSYGYSVSMSTNFNPDCCNDVEKFIDSGLDRLIVPVDGDTQSTYEKYRVGGNLALVEKRLTDLLAARKKRRVKHPFTEVQFLDWGYNHNDIPQLKRKVRHWEVDKLEIVSPDWASTNAHANPLKPCRCFWLWGVLTVDWALNYRSCTNAWTLPWPRINLKDIPSHEFWNHSLMVQARQYNVNKSAEAIAFDKGCHCNSCSDMLVVNRPPEYVCE
jgi:wyosine [tRNA(Phe)-imidazoG37] synthetase (radical SAM superfamily)